MWKRREILENRKLHKPRLARRLGADGHFLSPASASEGAMHLRAVGSRSYSSCAGPAESFVQNRACTEPHWAAAGTSNPRMTVAAASATLLAHFGRPRYMSAVFDCIPRASTCETALEKRRAECIAQYCAKTRAAREQLRQRREARGAGGGEGGRRAEERGGRSYRRRPRDYAGARRGEGATALIVSRGHDQRTMIIRLARRIGCTDAPR